MNTSNEEFNKALFNLDNIKIIKKALGKYYKILNHDELKSCSYLGLWESLKRWDLKKGKKFTTYLYDQVKWHCQKLINDNKKTINLESLSSNVQEKVKSDNIYILECMSKIPKKYKDILYKYYFERYNLEEIGKINNYTKQAAQQNIKKALKSLKNQVLKDGYYE